MDSSRIIKLDIGGTVFKTSRSTLTKYDCMFRAMLDSEIPLGTDESGCIFIDRDPSHFHYILNFLRDGTVNLPEDQVAVEQILAEAQFYLIQGLVDICKNPTCYRIMWTELEVYEAVKVANKDIVVLTWPAQYLNSCSQSLNNIIKDFLTKNEDSLEVLIKRGTDPKYWGILLHPLDKHCSHMRFDGDEEFDNSLLSLFRNSTS